MKKVISFSLYGSIPMYTEGAIQNAVIAQELFPDWICRFYVGSGVDGQTMMKLENMKNTQIFKCGNDVENALAMFWRFYTVYDKDVDVMISRDVDSRLSVREKEAIDDWLESDKSFHIMRDHPYHDAPILGGMWGTKNTDYMRDLFQSTIQETLKEFRRIPSNELREKGYDQHYLWNVIYPRVVDDSIAHDPYFQTKYKNTIDFPSKRDYNDKVIIIGQVFDENENYGGDWKGDLHILKEREGITYA